MTLAVGGKTHAQCFSEIHMPSDVCPATVTTVTIGYADTNTAVICRPQTTLGHSERIFLPDGISCGEDGCSYRSYVTFNAFEPNATVTSVEDINYVRLNIEHSYLGDIFIGITCPSGQQASLMNWSGSGQSSCTNTVPTSQRGWSSGDNASGGTYLGDALDEEDGSDKCDSTLTNNAPGIGWNYCWSNSTTAGISYAPGDAIFYRSANTTLNNDGHIAIDSSNVDSLSNFYHPNQSFSNLVGCPLNGNWYIEVIDAFSYDNGYIFGWDISLNANLVPTDECVLTIREMEGPYSQRINDSVYTISWPDEVNADTTVAYTFRLVNSCNDTLDTVIFVTLHPTVHTAQEIEDCPVVWNAETFTHDTLVIQMLATQFGCDSIDSVQIISHSNFEFHLYDTIYEGESYTFEGISCDTTGTYTVLLTTSDGCDSLLNLHLQCNRRTYVDSALCLSDLPLVWNGVVFNNRTHTGPMLILADSVHLSGRGGVDSLVVMHVTAYETTASVEHHRVCDSLVWRDNQTYTATTSEPFLTFENQWGCDSIVHLDLIVDSTRLYIHRQTFCDSVLWTDNRWYHNSTLGLSDTLVAANGCDSIVLLDLIIAHSTYEEDVDTFCHGQTYHWHGHSVGSDSARLTLDYLLADTLSTIHGCDSILVLRLTKMAQPLVELSYEANCQRHAYVVTATTDAAYYRWSSDPADPAIEGSENQLTINARPMEPTVYTFYADYREEPLCPHRAALTLYNADFPKAVLKVNPEALKYNSLDYTAYDVSDNYLSREWFVDGIRQTESSRELHGRGNTEADTIEIALSVYNGSCHDTAVYLLPLLRVGVFAPNAFTPNLDANNRFTLVTHGVIDGELFIYNREGLLVFQTTDFGGQGWDGDNNPQGNYVWRFNYHAIDFPNSLKTDIGTVLLLR